MRPLRQVIASSSSSRESPMTFSCSLNWETLVKQYWMDHPLLMLVPFSWSLKFISLLMFFPSYIMESASYICFGVFLDDTWRIKWSLIESTMILIAFIRSCPCFSLASSSLGYAISSLMYFSRPFSFKMRPILYFQAWRFSMPSNLSSSLMLRASYLGGH